MTRAEEESRGPEGIGASPHEGQIRLEIGLLAQPQVSARVEHERRSGRHERDVVKCEVRGVMLVELDVRVVVHEREGVEVHVGGDAVVFALRLCAVEEHVDAPREALDMEVVADDVHDRLPQAHPRRTPRPSLRFGVGVETELAEQVVSGVVEGDAGLDVPSREALQHRAVVVELDG